jgi:hypothetical protein
VKLFGVQSRRKTAKPLLFFEFMKATFNCGGDTRQQPAGVRLHKRNSLDPRKDNFFQLMMQSSCVFKRDAGPNKLYCTVLMAHILTMNLIHTILICF